MNRPWKAWSVFAVCAIMVLAVLGWLSLTTLNLERAQLEAAERAELEEHARLALWRLDSALAPLLVEESARPWSAYEAFFASEIAYTRAGINYNRARQGDVLVPSPLLSFSSSNILLHFQFRPGQRATSPQVPEGEQRTLAESGYTSPEHITLAAQRLEQMRQILGTQVARSRPAAIDQNKVSPPDAIFANGDLLARESGLSNFVNAALPNVPPALESGALGGRGSQSEMAQSLRNTAEFVQRANASQQGQLQVIEGNSRFNDLLAGGPPAGVPSVTSVSAENVFKPIWLDDALVLGRRVSQGKTSLIQGVWLNWSHLRPTLLATIHDLFPEANLEPAPSGTGNEARLLASLPVRLVPGPVSRPSPERWTPLRLTLAFAWIFVLGAAVTIGFLLHGTMSLSERRAAFVSAVTHELRTPLMTFQMYSEMLAEGMIADEEQRRQYLTTLCSEANRLSHLVENVLAYARLERRSARSRIEQVSLRDLMTRVQPRLKERAALAGLTVSEKVAAEAANAMMHVDITAVEQILFNLVDNACKYGASHAREKVIGLEAELENSRRVRLRIKDHGPGLHPDAARHLFEPFSKSAQEAAHTAPGVGLGLALCRRLSRSMGGDLRLIPGDKDNHGACFELTLPVCAPGPTTLG